LAISKTPALLSASAGIEISRRGTEGEAVATDSCTKADGVAVVGSAGPAGTALAGPMTVAGNDGVAEGGVATEPVAGGDEAGSVVPEGVCGAGPAGVTTGGGVETLTTGGVVLDGVLGPCDGVVGGEFPAGGVCVPEPLGGAGAGVLFTGAGGGGAGV